MTRHEAVQAYLAGSIDRREFVRRLTIAGVSTAAALTYAQSLTSAASAAPTSRGAHGLKSSLLQYVGDGTKTPRPAGTLPNTGTGVASGGSVNRNGLLGALAAAGAGVVVLGRKFRRADAEI